MCGGGSGMRGWGEGIRHVGWACVRAGCGGSGMRGGGEGRVWVIRHAGGGEGDQAYGGR